MTTCVCVVRGVQKQMKLCPFFEKICKTKTRFIQTVFIKQEAHTINFERHFIYLRETRFQCSTKKSVLQDIQT
ncbi:hypothetical protein Hanom_Chr01g00012131 [Helianthus anomalus]